MIIGKQTVTLRGEEFTESEVKAALAQTQNRNAYGGDRVRYINCDDEGRSLGQEGILLDEHYQQRCHEWFPTLKEEIFWVDVKSGRICCSLPWQLELVK